MFSDGIYFMKKINLFLLVILISCSSKTQIKTPQLSLYPLQYLEGLSGLSYHGQNQEGDLIFWSHTDRGPNATEIMDPKLGQKRPFLKPKFNPYWIKFSVNQKSKEVKVLTRLDLSLTGLPNTKTDELPVNEKGMVIDRDLMGIDPEAICFDGEYVWMGEEYRPSILKFDLKGNLLRRFVPEESFTFQEMQRPALKGIVSQNLPTKLKNRKLNRGFEGLACGKGKVFAILQSPLSKEKHEVVFIEFDSVTEKVIKEFSYPLDAAADKIGDLVLVGAEFYAIEQNGNVGKDSFHKVFRFQLGNEISLKKELKVDLVKVGFDFADKIEGLAVLEDGSIVIVNDNDFGIENNVTDPLRKSFLGIISF